MFNIGFLATAYEIARFYAAHAAAFGGLATAAYLAYEKNYPGAWAAFLTAMAAFGLNLNPATIPNSAVSATNEGSGHSDVHPD